MFRSGTQEQRKQRNTHKQLSKLPVYKETKIHTLQNIANQNQQLTDNCPKKQWLTNIWPKKIVVN